MCSVEFKDRAKELIVTCAGSAMLAVMQVVYVVIRVVSFVAGVVVGILTWLGGLLGSDEQGHEGRGHWCNGGRRRGR